MGKPVSFWLNEDEAELTELRRFVDNLQEKSTTEVESQRWQEYKLNWEKRSKPEQLDGLKFLRSKLRPEYHRWKASIAQSKAKKAPVMMGTPENAELPLIWEEGYGKWFTENFPDPTSRYVHLEGSSLPAVAPVLRPPSYTRNLHQLMFEIGMTFVPFPSHHQFLELIDSWDYRDGCTKSHRTLAASTDDATNGEPAPLPKEVLELPPLPTDKLLHSDDLAKPDPLLDKKELLFIGNLPYDWTAREVFFMIKVLTGVDVLKIHPIMTKATSEKRPMRTGAVLALVYRCHIDFIVSRVNGRVLFDENGLWVATNDDQLRMFHKYANFIARDKGKETAGPGHKHLFPRRPYKPITICFNEKVASRSAVKHGKSISNIHHPLCECRTCKLINSCYSAQTLNQYLEAIKGKIAQPGSGEMFIDVHSRVPPPGRERGEGGCNLPIRPYNILLSAGSLFDTWRRENEKAGAIDMKHYCRAAAANKPATTDNNNEPKSDNDVQQTMGSDPK